MSDKAMTFEEALRRFHDSMPAHGCGGLCLEETRAAHAREVAEARSKGRVEAFREAIKSRVPWMGAPGERLLQQRAVEEEGK